MANFGWLIDLIAQAVFRVTIPLPQRRRWNLSDRFTVSDDSTNEWLDIDVSSASILDDTDTVPTAIIDATAAIGVVDQVARADHDHALGRDLIGATGDETSLFLGYVANKSTSGNDFGFVIDRTDTSSPGTAPRMLSLVNDGNNAWSVDPVGRMHMGPNDVGGQSATLDGTWFFDPVAGSLNLLDGSDGSASISGTFDGSGIVVTYGETVATVETIHAIRTTDAATGEISRKAQDAQVGASTNTSGGNIVDRVGLPTSGSAGLHGLFRREFTTARWIREQYTALTTTATGAATAWFVTLSDAFFTLRVEIHAVETTSGDGFIQVMEVAVNAKSGTAILMAQTNLLSFDEGAGLSAIVDVTGSTVRVRVTPGSADSTDWDVFITLKRGVAS